MTCHHSEIKTVEKSTSLSSTWHAAVLLSAQNRTGPSLSEPPARNPRVRCSPACPGTPPPARYCQNKTFGRLLKPLKHWMRRHVWVFFVWSWSIIPGPWVGPCVGSVTAQWTAASQISSPAEFRTDAQSARWHDAQLTGRFPAGRRWICAVQVWLLKGFFYLGAASKQEPAKRSNADMQERRENSLHSVVWREAHLICTQTVTDCFTALRAGFVQLIKIYTSSQKISAGISTFSFWK